MTLREGSDHSLDWDQSSRLSENAETPFSGMAVGLLWKFSCGRKMFGRRNWRQRQFIFDEAGVRYQVPNGKQLCLIPWKDVAEILDVVRPTDHPQAVRNPRWFHFGLRFRWQKRSCFLLMRAGSHGERLKFLAACHSYFGSSIDDQLLLDMQMEEEEDDDDDFKQHTQQHGSIRSLVSKKKIRYQEDGFDLDLTYITYNLIAMGFPSTGREALYRNPYESVRLFFDTYHKDKYRVYNLCSERDYPLTYFNGYFEHYPFDDHNPPPLALVQPFAHSAARFLSAAEDHVIAVHCKAGKGRTGTFLAALLLYTQECATAAQALQVFGDRRTSDGKGVTIPSQKRYVAYSEQMFLNGLPVPPPAARLTQLSVNTVPRFDTYGGCDPYLRVYQRDPANPPTLLLMHDTKAAKNGKVKAVSSKEKHFSLILPNILIVGDFKIVVYDHDPFSADDVMFHFWLHTAFLPPSPLKLAKADIDKACKDKKGELFDKEFSISLAYRF
eukprot:NODE_1108_length_1653_cov_24.275229_g1041_i0.p1 GENE.NODE_1108_length_1653_cov_24.275229_g1041_i0~~NODE_1108_length_1653_cov_24.275229_g1041_i0.p1  ORF type:complete len:496 (-),score=121.34 NODE_1108_length_1653_cov_24.275229_g1041_i0:37-1524(-)